MVPVLSLYVIMYGTDFLLGGGGGGFDGVAGSSVSTGKPQPTSGDIPQPSAQHRTGREACPRDRVNHVAWP